MFDLKDADFFEMDEEDFDTVLATDITFSGKIVFSQPFMIKGKVSGNIEATSDLIVDTDAVVKANISATRVLVRGTVEGDIVSEKLVFVTATGTVKGNITSAQVVLEPGSIFIGRCSMTNQ
jgi:cytoskeletal protein CcmA (bactofilin family)